MSNKTPNKVVKYDFHHLSTSDRKEYNKLYYQSRCDEMKKQITEKQRIRRENQKAIKELEKMDLNDINYNDLDLSIEYIDLFLNLFKHKLTRDKILELKNIKQSLLSL